MNLSHRLKKIVPTFLALCALLIGSTVQASETTDPMKAPKSQTTYKLDKSQAVWDEELQAYVIPMKKGTNGQLVPMNEKEKQIYLDEVESTPTVGTKETLVEDPTVPVKEVYPEADYREYWIFERKASYEAYLPTQRVTADIYCNTSTCNISKQLGYKLAHSIVRQFLLKDQP